eukprot:2784234-Amphidinium_carterae.1
MESVHRLLTRVYIRFAHMMSKPSGTRRIGVVVEDEHVGADAPEAIMDNEEGDDGLHGALVSFCQAAENTADETKQATLNNQLIVSTQRWLLEKPWSHMVLLRTVLAPLAKLLHSQLELASSVWADHIKAEILKLQSTDYASLSKDFPVCVAADHKLENTFFSSLLSLLLETHHWDYIDEHDRTMNMRCEIFRACSRAGCSVKQLVWLPHDVQPVKAFTLLTHPDSAPNLAAQGKCCKDSWVIALEQAS